MKNFIISLIIFLSLANMANAQSITSFNITPANPTSTDTIRIIIECTFPNGSCEGSVTGTIQTGNTIYADAMHCMGMLTVICTDFDTVIIPPQSVGQYTFIYSLSAGQGIPCTPGIVPDDIDTLVFDVDNSTGIIGVDDKLFSVISNSENNSFRIHNLTATGGILKIFSSDGKLVLSQTFEAGESEISRAVKAGIYIISAEISNRKYTSKVVVFN